MTLRELYKAILLASGAIVTDDDLISVTRPGGEPVFCMIGDKRMAMPTDKLLNKGAFNDDGGLIAFHPLCENVVLETSPVLTQLEKMMTFRLTWVLRELVMQLTTVASNPKQHKKMKITTHGLLSAMPEADDRTRKDFIKIMENSTTVGAKKLVSLYVRKGGTYGGEKVSRLARFFPSIVDALDQEKRSLFGVSLRIADVPAFLALFEYILPEYRDADRYASPSNSMVAPTFHALAKTYAKVANQLNKIIDIHVNQLTDPDSLRINTDWSDCIADLNPYRELIPVLPGNDGAEGTKVVKVAPTAKTTAPQIGGVTPPTPTAVGGSKNGVSVDDFIRAITPPPQNYYGFQRQPDSAFRGRGFRQQEEGLPSWAQPQQSSWGSGQSGGGFSRGGRGGGSGRGTL